MAYRTKKSPLQARDEMIAMLNHQLMLMNTERQAFKERIRQLEAEVAQLKGQNNGS